MVISDTNKEFLDNLIEYYVNEAKSYKEIAQEYDQIIKSVRLILHLVLSLVVYTQVSFKHILTRNKLQMSKIIEEFNQIIMENAMRIKNAIQEENSGSE